MIKSMTGYGRGETLLDGRKIIIEIRSTNHRFCDISLKLPRRFSPLEADVKKYVGSRASRGKIDVTAQFDNNGEDTCTFAINLPLARTVYKMLESLKQEFGLGEEISLATILSFKDIIAPEKETPETQHDWETLHSAVERALDSLQQMQEAEGVEITNDMRSRITIIRQGIRDIEALFPQSLAARQQALRERIGKWCEGVELDEARMAQEIAYLADKGDITEELIRAQSHLKQFEQWLDSSEAVGRKLDFLIQELNREVNTIGSKASDSQISQTVVLIKNELEKIREQVQNIL
jgi:uncharacterized protein (TIGR00255 family)